MKKLFAIVAMLGLFATAQVNAQGQEAPAAPVENVTVNVDSLKAKYSELEAQIANPEGMDSAAVAAVKAEMEALKQQFEPAPAEDVKATTQGDVEVEEGGVTEFHKALKTKFIEGDPLFMAIVSIALVFGLAFCIERIIYLSFAKVSAKVLMASIADALSKGDVEAAKTICRNTPGPVAAPV